METFLSETIFSLVLAVAIPGILFGFVSLHSDDTYINQEFYVKDIALTVNSMLSVEGKVVVNYIIPDKYDVKLEENKVNITVKSLTKSFSRFYPYIASKNFNIKLEQKNGVLILKKIEKW